MIKKYKPVDNFLNQYFDHVYVVNLKFNITDRLRIAKHLKDHAINFEIYEATNGYKGEIFEKYQKYQKRELGDLKRYKAYSENEKKKGLAFIDSAGAMGYIDTYLNILNDAKKNGYKRFLILEDDILLSRDFENKFKILIQNIDQEWKILQLGASQYGWDSIDLKSTEEKGYYFPVYYTDDNYTYGSFAMALDSTVVDELIESQSAFEASFDFLPIGELYKKYIGKCFIAYPNIVIPDVSDSSIRQPKCQHTESLKRKWLLDDFEYPLEKPSIGVLMTNTNNLKYYHKFSNVKELPFNLRLYFNSNDSLRPLHNVELLNKIENKIHPLGHPVTFPNVDYVVTIEEEQILEESDIIKFLEYKVGILEENLTPLKEINVNNKDIQKGRVSVIVAVYKKITYLRKTLTSIIMQDYDDIEIVVVIDQEIDSMIIERTRELISSFNDEYMGCNAVLIEHSLYKNIATARNIGILNSNGEYICFLDENDIYLPGRLSKSIFQLRQVSKTCAAVYSGYIDCNLIENGVTYYQVEDLIINIFQSAFEKNYLPVSTVIYRREALENLNGFDESYSYYQDSEFHLRYFEHYTMENIQESLLQFGSDYSEKNEKIEDPSVLQSKTKFLNQFFYIAKSVIRVQHESLLKQEKKIFKLAQLKTSLDALVKIRFLYHPIQKLKSYKKLMAIHRKLK